MTTEIDNFDTDGFSDYDFSDYTEWALATGLWDGRPITWQEAPHFQDQVAARITQLFFSREPSDPTFDALAAQLAWLGTPPDGRELLLRDIQALVFSKGEILQAGFRKSASKFWKKHKTAILIGLGAAALDELNKKAAPEPKKRLPPPTETVAQTEAPPPFPEGLVYLENGVLLNGEYLTYQQILQAARCEDLFNPPPPTFPIDAQSPRFFPYEQITIEPTYPPPFLSKIEPCGYHNPQCLISGINGMHTSSAQAQNHAHYIKQLAGGQDIEWVYNKSNGLLPDLGEIFTMNYLGYSPNTAKELGEKWTAFHEANKDNPNAKLIHICHSQGAIHTRNTLLSLPPEIRDRVIVIAIAPGAVVPDHLCYRSFNYASKNDPVPRGEILFFGLLDSNEVGTSKALEEAFKNREQLILLEPHPDAGLIDHDFQSPTFKKKIEEHIQDYLNKNGEYK
ncbi:MAG: hypothetical protein KGJ02_04405 [Verrucomicrobiota bacterium]|nr:hypothetical protein [Verrucomicrobiota bacterium]